MSAAVYGRVQTNRANLSKYRDAFKKNKEPDESFISPRPQPGTYQPHYFALLKLSGESKNHSYFTKQKNFSQLTEEEYKHELEPIKFYWEA